jgi:hypothetical protein
VKNNCSPKQTALRKNNDETAFCAFAPALLAGVQFNHIMDLMRLYSIHQRTLLW